MIRSVAWALVGPIVERVIIRAARSKGELPQPAGDPRVHAMGPDADRILMIGAGAVRGMGVASYDLGIGGQLARQLSALTGRGADVELLGVPGITAPVALGLISEMDISRFDALVIMLGNREVIGLRPVAAWERDIRAILDLVARRSPAVSVFVIGLAPLPGNVPLGRLLCRVIDRQVDRLNAATREASGAAGAFFIPFSPDELQLGDIGSTSTYIAWAQPIADGMHAVLDATGSSSRDELTDEALRQASLDQMDILDKPLNPDLLAVVSSAKDLFGVAVAAVNLIDNGRVHVLAAAGIPRADVPRSDSFSAMTVHAGGALVVNDARLDERASSLGPAERGFVFYAGYPIEAPDRQRIGALCLFDSAPRAFTSSDESLLRQLALRAQAELWSASSA